MSLPWSSKGFKATPINLDELMIIDSEDANPATQNKRILIGSIEVGEDNTASNVGAGDGWAKAKVGIDLPFKSLITNAPISTTVNTNDLTLTLDQLVDADISASAQIAFSKLASLSDGWLLIGSNSNVPTQVPMSGDATIINSGLLTISNNAIDDNKIATHTSTKITIANKPQLNSNIVYTDQANTYDSFVQEFPNSALNVLNPAGTFAYRFQSNPITANRNIQLPTLTANDTFAMVSHTQSLTNKTLVQPIISDFTNANHNHSTTASGGNLTNSALSTGVFSNITGIGVQSQDLQMGANNIKSLATPLTSLDAANKQYVDEAIEGLSWKDPALLATTGNITLSGEQSIDGVVTSSSRVLVKDQTSGAENGVYLSDAGAWSRTSDADSESDLVNMSIFIQQGSVNSDTSWVLTTDPPIVVDVTPLNYAQIAGSFNSPLTTTGDLLGYDTGDNRIPVGSNGQVLTANNAVALGVEWDTPTLTPWVSNIDASGFGLTNLSFLESNATNVASAGAIRLGNNESINWRNAGNSADWGITSGTNTLFVGPGWNSVIFDSFITVDMEGASINAGFIQIDNFGGIDLDNGDITSVGFMEMLAGGQLLLGGTSTQTIEGDAGGILFGLPTGDTYDFQIASTSEYEFSATQADFKGNNLVNLGYLETDATNPAQSGVIRLGDTENIRWRNDSNTADVGFNVSSSVLTLVSIPQIEASSLSNINAPNSGLSIDFIQCFSGIDFGSSDITSLNAMELDPSGIILFNGVSTQGIQGTGAGLIFTLPTGDTYDFKINSVSEYTFGASGANFSTNYIDLGEITTPAAPGAAIGRIYTKDVSGATHLFIQDDTTETDLNLGAGASPLTTKGDIYTYDTGDARLPVGTNGQVLSANSATATGLQWIAAGAGSQTPWTSNIDADTFNLFDLGYIETTTANPASLGFVRMAPDDEIVWRNDANTGDLELISTGDELNILGWDSVIIDATVNIDLSATAEVDAGSALVRVSSMELGSHIFTTGSGASAGRIRLDNLDQVAWRNFANSADFAIQLNASDQFLFNSELNIGNNQIKAVSDPTDGSDAATKTYVDNLVNGLSWKNPAEVATTGNITLSGEQTIDGVLTSTDRVLVKDQTSGAENGVYVSAAGAWTRSTDADSEADLLNMSIYISQGTVNQDTSWVLTTDAPIVVDTTVLNYAQVGAGAGNPLTTKGDIFGYDTANNRIPVGTDGQVLTANSAVALGVDYQSKEFTGTWTANHDAGGFNLLNLGVLESNAINPAASGEIRLGDTQAINWRNNGNTGDLGIRIDNDQFVFNVTFIEGSSISTINAPNATATFDAVNVSSGIDLGGGSITSVADIELDSPGNIIMGGGYIDLTEITTPANPGANVARLYSKDVSTVTKLFFRDSAGTETELGGGGGSQTPWTSNIDADGFDLTDLGHIQMRPTTDPGTGLNSIYAHDVDDMTISVAGAAGIIKMRMNTQIEYEFKNNTIVMNGAGLTNPGNFLDANNNEYLQWVSTPSAVNQFRITNAATGTGPLLDTAGGDTNIDLRLQPKGLADGSVYIVNRAIKMGEQSTPTAPGAALAKLYVKDVTGRSHLFIQDDVGEVDLQIGASDTPWTEAHDFAGFLLTWDAGETNLITTQQSGNVLVNQLADNVVGIGESWGTNDGNLSIKNTNAGNVWRGELRNDQPVTDASGFFLITSAIAPASDTGTVPIMVFDSRQNDDTTVVTRDLFAWRNNGVDMMSLSRAGTMTFNNVSLVDLDLVRENGATASTPIGGTFLHMDLGSAIAWDRSSGTNVDYIDHVNDQIQIGFNNVLAYQFAPSTIALNDNTITESGGYGFGTSASASTLITGDADGMIFSVPTGDDFSLKINAVDEYTFSATALDVVGNDIDNIQNLVHDISTSGTDIDFTEDEMQTISIAANTTFTTANRAAGKSKVLKITTDGTLRTLTFPGWDWTSAIPADQAANKNGYLTLTCFGTTDASIVASYLVGSL